MQLFLSLGFGTLVFVPPVLFWLVLGFCSYIVIGNDDFASIIGVKSKMLKEPSFIQDGEGKGGVSLPTTPLW
jgi:hypothetical protein